MGGRPSKVDSDPSFSSSTGKNNILYDDKNCTITGYNTKNAGGGNGEEKAPNKQFKKSKEEWIEQMKKTSDVLKDLKDLIGTLEHKSSQEIVIKSNPCEKEECTVVKCYETERAGDKLKCQAAVDAYYECSKRAYQ